MTLLTLTMENNMHMEQDTSILSFISFGFTRYDSSNKEISFLKPMWISSRFHRTRLEIHTDIAELDYNQQDNLQLMELTPYQNFTYGLKSKDIKRQYPVMLLRFLKFAEIQGETIEEKCVSFYNFAIRLENRKVHEYHLMRYISSYEELIKRKEIRSKQETSRV